TKIPFYTVCDVPVMLSGCSVAAHMQTLETVGWIMKGFYQTIKKQCLVSEERLQMQPGNRNEPRHLTTRYCCIQLLGIAAFTKDSLDLLLKGGLRSMKLPRIDYARISHSEAFLRRQYTVRQCFSVDD